MAAVGKVYNHADGSYDDFRPALIFTQHRSCVFRITGTRESAGYFV